MRLNEYTTLGRTGLRVSPLCLGAMGFGTGWGWGADPKQSFETVENLEGIPLPDAIIAV
jgi:aryl-alcohol dehydrogenase-like predicted oxidoreductase